MKTGAFFIRIFYISFSLGLAVAALHLGFVALSLYQGNEALYAGFWTATLTAASLLMIASVLFRQTYKALAAVAFFGSLLAVALCDVSIANALNSLMRNSSSWLDALLIGLGFGLPSVGMGSAILLLLDRSYSSREL